MSTQFHLSIPVDSLERARAFYVGVLGCSEGRSGPSRLDIDFFGHHVVMHLVPEEARQTISHFHSDGATVSVRHFGVILGEERWQTLARTLDGVVDFSMPPQTIRSGTVEEQRIMMFPDGCGNIVEFKSIPPSRVFARQ